MKYVVEIDGVRTDVEVFGDGVRVDGETVRATLTRVPDSPVSVLAIGDAIHRVIAQRGDARGRYRLVIDGRTFAADALDERTRAIRDLSAANAAAAGPAPLVAPMPGLVVRVDVREGDAVAGGQALVVMEAMKMENELRAPVGGTVKRVAVVPGTAVEKGAVLVELA
ncbi:acetyl-CoA carboxylase biotin carboxyl carrier protein subunit [Gemmatimonadetes bacterium T265]|nr:acetyl-CoA carboxylase biotin carboxyl carrier protein subunit [Gemmatimonadetes bacterium T265]